MDMREFKNTYTEYSPCTVWDWCAKPTAQEIDARLCEFSNMGIHTVFIRPSKGLVLEYLSGDFFELVRTAARRSEKYDITLWLFDENTPASGHGGGEITSVSDYRMRDIVKADEKTILKEDIPIDGGFALRDMSKLRTAHRAPLSDITDHFVVQCFTDHTYTAYLRECKRFIGHEIHGFLTQINFPQDALLFSSSALKRLGNITPTDCAKALTSDDNSFKKKYYRAFSDCLADNFTLSVKRKCAENNLQLCVGVNGADFISRQLQYIKADTVCIEAHSESPDITGFKLAETVCAQFEKPLITRLLSPSFAPSSKRYNDAAFFVSLGSSRICYDSVAFSLADRRKYEEHTVTLSKQTENDVSGRLSRLSNICNKTTSAAKLLIIYSPENKEIIASLSEKLLQMGIPFHITEECIFEKYAEVSDEGVRIGILSYTDIIAPDTLSISDAFTGRKFPLDENIYSQLEELTPKDFPKISSESNIYINHRYDENSKYIFVSALDSDADISVLANGKALCVADSANGEIYKIPETDGKCAFTLRTGKTALLIYSDTIRADEAPPFAGEIEIIPSQKECDLPFTLAAADENILPLKRVNACFGKKSYRESNIDDLHREFYSLNDNETVKVKYPFTVNLKDIGSVTAYIEYADNFDSIELNGKKLTGFISSSKDPRFFGVDITEHLADGKNTFALEYKKFSNYNSDFSSLTPPHFYSFNPTSFEPIYLCGDFDCDGSLLTRIEEYGTDVSLSGMPHYYGALTYNAMLPDSDLSNTMLCVKGDFDICRIKVGKREQIFFTNSPMIEVFNLDCGEIASITIFNTPYNLLRPVSLDAKPFGLSAVELCKFSE
ncbi:MAG: hypothetical protein IJN36_00285 [Clostridia bacterium]|nr:hypothetical protein [Clostridia bacterium]